MPNSRIHLGLQPAKNKLYRPHFWRITTAHSCIGQSLCCLADSPDLSAHCLGWLPAYIGADLAFWAQSDCRYIPGLGNPAGSWGSCAAADTLAAEGFPDSIPCVYSETEGDRLTWQDEYYPPARRCATASRKYLLCALTLLSGCLHLYLSCTRFDYEAVTNAA